MCAPGFPRRSTRLDQDTSNGLSPAPWIGDNVPIAAIGIGPLSVTGFSDHSGQSMQVGGTILVAALGGLAVDHMTWSCAITTRKARREAPAVGARNGSDRVTASAITQELRW